MRFLYKVGVYFCFVCHWEIRQMYALGFVSTRYGIEVLEQSIHKEWSDRRRKFCHHIKTSVEGLISRNLVFRIISFPETAAAKPYIPVGEVVIHKSIDGSCHFCRFVVFVEGFYFLNEEIQL